jgi:hypothetical protein
MRRWITGFIRGAVSFLALCCTVPAQADTFGRFGYEPLRDVPGFLVDRSGIRARAPDSDQLLFPHPSVVFSPSVTNATAQTVDLDCGKAGPSAVRFSLIADSVDLYYVHGLELDLRCAVTPYLSWKDGSVAANVPTPSCQWLLLSFANDQPPIVLGFSGAHCSLTISGVPGSYRITCPEFSGWLRLMLADGLRPVHANDAASLGKLVEPVALESERWSAPTPRVLKQTIVPDERGLDAMWEFSGPGAIVPPAALLGELGGYPLAVLSHHHTVGSDPEAGPIEEVDGNVLKIRFPVREVKPGRSLGLSARGQAGVQARETSSQDGGLPRIIDLALSSLDASSDPSIIRRADELSSSYLSTTSYTVEPFTGQQLPFDAAGTGLEQAAAFSLLGQATLTALNSQEPNALFTSVSCRRDWWTWVLWSPDDAAGRRSSALAAVAGALSHDPVNRLLGAMLEAGLDAQRGLAVMRRRAGSVEPPVPLAEPLLDLRAGLFALRRKEPIDSSFFDLLESPLKVGTSDAVSFVDERDGAKLRWNCQEPKPSVINFFCGTEIKFHPLKNILRWSVERNPQGLAFYYLPNAAGPCEVRLEMTENGLKIPADAQAPAFRDGAAARR